MISAEPAGGTIVTSRLVIRPFTPNDLDALGAIVSQPRIMRFVGDGQPLDRAATAAWIANAAALAPSGLGSRAVVLAQTGDLIGWAGLIPTSEGGVELIYGLAEQFWGRGYATEAAGALVAAHSKGPVDATIDPENGASRRILEKLGFEEVGLEADADGLPTLRLRRPSS